MALGIASDLSELKEAIAAFGLSPVKLRRALREELGREPERARSRSRKRVVLRGNKRRAWNRNPIKVSQCQRRAGVTCRSMAGKSSFRARFSS